MSTEFDYFGDPKVGKLLDLVLQLSTELHVTRQRVRVVEALLTRSGALTAGAVDGFVSTEEEQKVLDRERDEPSWPASCASSPSTAPRSTRCGTSGRRR